MGTRSQAAILASCRRRRTDRGGQLTLARSACDGLERALERRANRFKAEYTANALTI
jgi:hypothetical protein